MAPYTADGSLADLWPEPEFADRLGARILAAVGDALVEEVARRTPRRTGKMKESWRRTKVADVGDGVLRTEIFNKDRRVVMVEYDVQPHRIDPKRKGAITIKLGDGRILRAGADHPGATGRHMLRDAMAWIEVRWPAIAQRELDRALREEGFSAF